jgi:hypothetical protein
MSVKTLYEAECDRCHRTETGTGKARTSAPLPPGWRRFSISEMETGPDLPMAPAQLDLCPGCQPQVTLDDAVTICQARTPGPQPRPRPPEPPWGLRWTP